MTTVSTAEMLPPEVGAEPSNPTIGLLMTRTSTASFDPGVTVERETVRFLAEVAVRAPSAFNLQNWRFIAIDTDDGKRRLRLAANDQPKITDAAVTFIVCGTRPDAERLQEQLAPFVAGGCMPADVAADWAAATRATYDANPRAQHDEAMRSASLAAAHLMIAAHAIGLSTCPIGGFDPRAVSDFAELREGEHPVVLVAVGRARRPNWPQKPRRPVDDVLSFA